jgi:hypothetical protein
VRPHFKMAGVYALWIDEVCMYVGKAGSNIGNRLSQHLTGLSPFFSTDPSLVTIAALPCDHPEYTELLYIFTLRPRLNRETKGLFV